MSVRPILSSALHVVTNDCITIKSTVLTTQNSSQARYLIRKPCCVRETARCRFKLQIRNRHTTLRSTGIWAGASIPPTTLALFSHSHILPPPRFFSCHPPPLRKQFLDIVYAILCNSMRVFSEFWKLSVRDNDPKKRKIGYKWSC